MMILSVCIGVGEHKSKLHLVFVVDLANIVNTVSIRSILKTYNTTCVETVEYKIVPQMAVKRENIFINIWKILASARVTSLQTKDC